MNKLLLKIKPQLANGECDLSFLLPSIVELEVGSKMNVRQMMKNLMDMSMDHFEQTGEADKNKKNMKSKCWITDYRSGSLVFIIPPDNRKVSASGQSNLNVMKLLGGEDTIILTRSGGYTSGLKTIMKGQQTLGKDDQQLFDTMTLFSKSSSLGENVSLTPVSLEYKCDVNLEDVYTSESDKAELLEAFFEKLGLSEGEQITDKDLSFGEDELDVVQIKFKTTQLIHSAPQQFNHNDNSFEKSSG